MSHAPTRFVALCVGASLALSSIPASAAIIDFTGKWLNADRATRGINQLSIRADNGQLLVHAWGKCHPNDCDWGEMPAQLFTPNAGVPVDAGADAAIVEFDKGGIQTMLVLQASGGTLSYKTFTIFTNSSRSNYHESGRMNRW